MTVPPFPALPIQPPTDHPYRFLAIAGLSGGLLSGAALLYAAIQQRDASRDRAQAVVAYVRRVDGIRTTARTVVGIGSRLDSLLVLTLAGTTVTPGFPNYGVSLRRYVEIAARARPALSRDQTSRLLQMSDSLDKALAAMNQANSAEAAVTDNFEVAGKVGDTLFLGSVITMTVGLVLWIGRNQRYQDVIVRADATKALDAIGAVVPWDLGWKHRWSYWWSHFVGKDLPRNVIDAGQLAAKERADRAKARKVS